ncbi:Acadl [Symbiodinium sp. CCMP2456]|nr:Acadl [Symbiodinium sp. CCMP2456]
MPAAEVPEGGGAPIRVVHLQARGEKQTVLDPVHAELRFLSKWRPHLPLKFEGSSYPTIAALGQLPAALSATHGVVARKDLRQLLAKVDPQGYGAALAADDEAFLHLLDRIEILIAALLYQDASIWETHTRPTLLSSAPPGFGTVTALTERRRQKQRLQEAMASRGLPAGAQIQSSLMILELRTALEALSERLGDQSFGKGGDKQAGSDREDRHGFSRLDARAYAHLVVLFSIPCDPGSCLQRLLCDFPSLSRFVGLVEERLPGTWPDYSTFMLALPPEDRPPPPPQSQGSVLVGPVEKRRPEWWELWGWSWGGRKRPVQFGGPGKAPPAIYAICFGMASGLSFAVALACGLGPGRPFAAHECSFCFSTSAALF